MRDRIDKLERILRLAPMEEEYPGELEVDLGEFYYKCIIGGKFTFRYEYDGHGEAERIFAYVNNRGFNSWVFYD